MMDEKMNTNKKPLLLTFAVDRIHDVTGKIFHYDYSKDMNVLDADSTIPFIEASHNASLLTIAKSDRECDFDDDRCFSELYTKTDEIREQDDEELNLSGIALRNVETGHSNAFTELYTKTEDNREMDDEDPDPSPWLLMQPYRELVSKTFADRERDDEDDDIITDRISEVVPE